MSRMPIEKYRPFAPIDLPDRRWPGVVIESAPLWCSVDLRDGNQALIEPMGRERKWRMFEALVRMGFKEIEVGFPASSRTDFDFVRELIDSGRIPDDVTIQVLTQARDDLIRRTMDSIRGARCALVHIYNSTSTLQRRVVFGKDRAGIVDIAVEGTRLIRELTAAMPETQVRLEYSPESFTGTELDFALSICEAVMDVWGPTPDDPIILNLPATVEMSTPNIFADQIEWFGRHIRDRDCVILSVHPHNDRGTAVAAAELAVMAGADRVEGTLFGNGERTGNVDVVTLALNLFSQGVDPELDLADINELVRVAEFCNRLPVHPRHPYAGDLVFTAFSGSHQDAIRKGLTALWGSGSMGSSSPTGSAGSTRSTSATRSMSATHWEVPYLPIDPVDVGRTYEAVIRINSQSGKGGVAYLLERDRGFDLPRRQQVEFSQIVQGIVEETGRELTSDEIADAFEREYLSSGAFSVEGHREDTLVGHDGRESRTISAVVSHSGVEHVVQGRGNGPIDAFVNGMARHFGLGVRVSDYREHSVGQGADAVAVAYVEVVCGDISTSSPSADASDAAAFFGVGRDSDIVTASLRAVISAVNRAEVRRAANAA